MPDYEVRRIAQIVPLSKETRIVVGSWHIFATFIALDSNGMAWAHNGESWLSLGSLPQGPLEIAQPNADEAPR